MDAPPPVNRPAEQDPLVERRVGVVVPFDFALDRELWRWAPEHVSLHLTRTPFVAAEMTTELAMAMCLPDAVRQATRDVLLPGPDVVAYSCTSGSFVHGAEGERQLTSVMTEAGAPCALTTAGALVRGLTELGVRRVAMVTPYVDMLSELLVSFLAGHGISTVSRVGLGLLGQIWRVPAAQVLRSVRAADHPDADAVFVSCTNLTTYDLIPGLERELGKPVLTANQVTMWAALRAIGERAVGPGQRLIDPVPAHPVAGGPDGVAGPPAETALHKIRVQIPDESGALARLSDAVAAVGGNILGLAVHGHDSSSVVDELLVGSAGALDAADLAGAVADTTGGAVRLTAADPHELVDGPTRALDLVARAVHGRDETCAALCALVHADRVEYRDDAPDPDPHLLVLPLPEGAGWLVGSRAWAPFTVTEQARAAAFLRAIRRVGGSSRTTNPAPQRSL